eukprot:15434194-Alexandrium_andersonii.AAC.1
MMGRGDATLPDWAGECDGRPAVWAGLITTCGGLLTLGGERSAHAVSVLRGLASRSARAAMWNASRKP